jgi:hypothetical protein
MWEFIQSIPHPTLHQIIITLELGMIGFVGLWIPKRVIDQFGNDAISRARNRRWILREHVYNEHTARLTKCQAGQCAVLGAVESVIQP